MLKYINGQYFTCTGILDEEEMEYTDQLELQWKRSLKNPRNPFVLLEIFPEARSCVRIQAKEILEQLKELYTLRKELEGFITNPNNCTDADQWFWLEVVNAFYLSDIPKLEKQLSRMTSAIDFHTPGRKRDPNAINEADIQRAREVPIDTFIDFNRAGFSRCIAHDEKTPSMKYYHNQNRVHCFSCQFSEDSIGVIMRFRDIPFLEAVSFLTGK